MKATIILLTFVLSAVAPIAHADEANPNRLDWLTGCWQSADGQTREIWSASEDGYYFGYSVVLKDGHVVFFEQLRIDPAPMPVLQAYPRGNGPSSFTATELADASVTFANAAHDFPQKIKYWRDGDTLKAMISRIDDSSPGHFDYLPCLTE